jgi:hypothetical protein
VSGRSAALDYDFLAFTVTEEIDPTGPSIQNVHIATTDGAVRGDHFISSQPYRPEAENCQANNGDTLPAVVHCFPGRLVEQRTGMSFNLIEISSFEFLPAFEMRGIAEHDAIFGPRMDSGEPMARAAWAPLSTAASLRCALGNAAIDFDRAARRDASIWQNADVNKVGNFHVLFLG